MKKRRYIARIVGHLPSGDSSAKDVHLVAFSIDEALVYGQRYCASAAVGTWEVVAIWQVSQGDFVAKKKGGL